MSSQVNTYNVGEDITLKALYLTGQTLGRMIAGQSTVYVQDLSGLTLTNGAPILISGAGYIGGDLRTTVVSSDGVGAIVVADSCKTEADRVIVGTPTDPATVTCKIKLPDASELTRSTSAIVVGLWKANYTPTLDGDHFFRFTGTGSAASDRWRKFTVLAERVP